jgi:hypothetical protein
MRIVFLLPGREFSNKFIDIWTNLIYSIPKEWKWFHVSGYVPNIFYNRQALLERAKMFNPTHYMWIDSDQTFNFKMFEKLINHNLPIISGIYKKSPTDFACCDINGKTITVDDLNNTTELLEVKANGMGFMLVKREVFDSIANPFEPLDFNQWEDFTFQEKARKAGFKSYIDTTLIVGHEKKIIL